LRAATYTRIFYEDFVQDPKITLAKIIDEVGLPDQDLEFIEGKSALLNKTTHTVAGNPMRFKEGPIEIRADNEWLDAMPKSQILKVTMFSFPLLLRYGYSIFPKS
jgi:hypothetical protein